jgi:hypothetical protein
MKTSTIIKILRFAPWGAATFEDFLASEGTLVSASI